MRHSIRQALYSTDICRLECELRLEPCGAACGRRFTPRTSSGRRENYGAMRCSMRCFTVRTSSGWEGCGVRTNCRKAICRMPFCRMHFAECHFADVFLSTCPKVEMLNVEMRFADMPSRNGNLPKCQFAKILISRNVNLPKCDLPKCQFAELAICRNID